MGSWGPSLEILSLTGSDLTARQRTILREFPEEVIPPRSELLAFFNICQVQLYLTLHVHMIHMIHMHWF